MESSVATGTENISLSLIHAIGRLPSKSGSALHGQELGTTTIQMLFQLGNTPISCIDVILQCDYRLVALMQSLGEGDHYVALL